MSKECAMQVELEGCNQELATHREQEKVRRKEQEWIQAYSEWFDGPEGAVAIAEFIQNPNAGESLNKLLSGAGPIPPLTKRYASNSEIA